MFPRALPFVVLAIVLAAAVRAGAQAPQINCAEDFTAVRTFAETRGKAIQAAAKRKAPPQELCPLFRAYAEAEAKMVQFLEKNQAWCQIPAEAIKGSKANHAKTLQVRTQVCQAAANPAAAAPPSAGLSGVLTNIPGSAPPPPAGGTGVFDTLTGNALQR
ncbi:MAG TPA: hypothetical protein VIG34_07400 [Xanthobacteraceae bacterium]